MKLHDVKRRAKNLIKHLREYGPRSSLRLIRQKLTQSYQTHSFLKTDILGFYDFVRLPAAEPNLAACTAEQNTINWVIPAFGKGSGGHLNIFRFVANLERLGYECRIIIVGSPQPSSAQQARQEISDWFFPLKASVYLGMDTAPPATYTIATEWRTAYWVRAFSATRYRCYFVQDFEPWFFAMGSEYVFAEETYRFGFIGITAGNWLKEKLASEFNMQTYSVSFSYDKERYKPIPRRLGPDNVQRIFFYARPPTARRAFELGLMVLDEVVKRRPAVQVVFAGWDVSNYVIPFKHLNAGLLSLDELPDLYSQCDAALVLSLSNLSLLPLELMACGTPVVSNDAAWTRWLLNSNNARLAPTTVAALADALCAVLDDPAETARLRAGGFATVEHTDWSAEAGKMADILRNIAATDLAGSDTLNSKKITA